MSSAVPTPMFTGQLSFLSNFDTTPFWCPPLNVQARSAEHAFNALKTLDRKAQIEVLTQASPAMAKRIGRRVPLRPDWNAGARVWAMQAVLAAKFAVPQLRERLTATGDQLLVETNYWHDNFWGDCRCGRAGCAAPGKNMLGELLMALRAQ